MATPLNTPESAELNAEPASISSEIEAGSLRDTALNFAHPATLVILALTAAVAFVWRFVITSPLWLDEALSANISALGISDIFGALKSDGHPPLYYLLLHGWSAVLGDGDLAVRSFSAITTIVTVPMMYLLGKRLGTRRLGLTMAMVFAFSPYVLRYGSETRMYALVMAEVVGTYLAVLAATKAPSARNLFGIALGVGLLLWTHYWTMWMLAATGGVLLIRWWQARRAHDANTSATTLKIIAAFAVGGLTFIPWLPTLLYQNAHTGTPWAPSFRGTTLVVTSLTEFAGGPYSEAQIGMLLSVVLIAIGIFGTGTTNHRIQLDLVVHRAARIPLTLLVGTIVVASAVGMINGMAFAPRYAAVFFPFVVILIALGIDQFRGGLARDVVLVALALLSVAGMFLMTRQVRSQSQVTADEVAERASSGIVVTCPDQLGPSMNRVLDGSNYEVLTYPRFESAKLVDWVDYKERNDASDPVAFANQLVERAQGQPLFIVMGENFLTLEGQCEAVIAQVAALRPGDTVMVADGDEYYEPMALAYFPAPTDQ